MQKKFIILPLLLLCGVASVCFSQNKTVDSLLNVLKTAKEDTNKVNGLNYLSKYAGWRVANFDTAIYFAQQAKQLSEKIHYLRGLGDANNNFGQAFVHKSEYPEALKYLFTSLSIRESMNDKYGMAGSYNNIGTVFLNQSKYDEALKYFLRAAEINKAIGNKAWLIINYNNIANVYVLTNKLTEALKIFTSALEIANETNDNYSKSRAYSGIGSVYVELKNFDAALQNQKAAQSIDDQLGDKQQAITDRINIAGIYLKLNKPKEAYAYLNESYELIKEAKSGLLLYVIYKGFAEADSASGNYKGAYENYKMYVLYRDSVVNEENTKKSLQTQMQYDFDKKEAVLREKQEKEKLIGEEKNRKQKVITFSVLGCLLLVAGFAVFVMRSLRTTKKQKQIIELKNEETEHQKKEIEEKQKEILDSIRYAKRIQMALMPNEKIIRKNLEKLRGK